MKRCCNLLIVLLTAAAFTAGWLLGHRSAAPIRANAEKLRIDTIYYKRPVPASVTRRPLGVQVPRLIFAERVRPAEVLPDTAAAADSLSGRIAFETRIYEDSTYRAQVSGPAVGPMKPSLDWIRTYDRTHTITRTLTQRNRFAVTAGIGAAYTEHGIRPVAGIQVGVILWSF